jgi:hypothetical protein
MRRGVGDGPRAVPHGGEAWGRRGASAAVGRRGVAGPGYGGLNTFQIQSNSNYFKTFETLTDPKMAFPSTKNLK